MWWVWGLVIIGILLLSLAVGLLIGKSIRAAGANDLDGDAILEDDWFIHHG